MDKLITWLFQRTSDGATYLQVIIIGILMIILIHYLFETIKEISDILKEEERDSDGL